MGFDPLSPITPARLNALLLPVGKIRRSKFLGFVERLQAENVVRLGDVTPDGRPNRNTFSPLAFPTGLIVYNLTISHHHLPHLDLFPFELFREPLAVLAIADSEELQLSTSIKENEVDDLSNGGNEASIPQALSHLYKELAFLKDEYPRALVHQILLFDYSGSDPNITSNEDVITIPPLGSSRPTTMKTVMCDISSLVLGEMSDFARTIQGLPAVESPKISAFASQREDASISEKIKHRMTMPAQLPKQNGTASHISTSGWRPAVSPAPITFDEISWSSSRGSLKPRSTNSPREHSRERMSMQGLGSASASDRSKIRVQGRIGVVIGTLYLQAGRWPDALKEFVESAEIARINSDYLWYAKSLESILVCLLMLGWAGMDFQIPQICYPNYDKSSSIKPTSPDRPDNSLSTPTSGNRLVSLQNLTNLLPDLLSNILNLYTRAANITDESLPQLPLSETVLRFTRLLATIHIRDGMLDDDGLKHFVVNQTLVPPNHAERPRGSIPLRKSEISSLLFQAMPLSHFDLPTTDMIIVLIGMASVLTTLDLHRKKAFILKELLNHLTPGLVQARKVGAAEIGIHPAAGLSALATTAFAINALDVGPGNMEDGLRALLDAIGKPHGVVGLNEPQGHSSHALSKNYNQENSEDVAIRALRRCSLWTFGDLTLKVDILKSCINFCEALPDFQGVLQFTVELLHTTRRALMLPVDLHAGLPSLPQDEQIRLLNNIKRTVGAANKLGVSSLEAEYWDDFLIRDIEVLEMAQSRRPIVHSKRMLDFAAPGISEDGATKGPFLHNAFAKTAASKIDKLLIAEDYANFRVTFQNPFEFDVEIESLRFEVEDNEVETISQSFWIGPYCMQDMVILARAMKEGPLNITGLIVKVKICRERRFSIFKKKWKPITDFKLSRLGLSIKGVPKERPLSAISDTIRSPIEKKRPGPEAEILTFNVTKPQPSISVVSTSLSQSAVMVLEGESKLFTITLKNSSHTPVDLLLFTFQDSTLTQIQAAMSNKDISPAELYELELQLSTRPSLRWYVEEGETREPSIPAGGTATFTVEVFGKPGLLDGVVQIDYAYIGIPRSEIKDKFYTRQVLFPITVTVNASAELARCDILPFTSDFSWANQRRKEQTSEPNTNGIPPSTSNSSLSSTQSGAGGENEFIALLSRLGLGSHGSDHCMLLLDIRNTWPNPLSVSVQVRHNVSSKSRSSSPDPWRRAYTVHENIQPGHVARLVLVLPRVFIENPHASIPSLDITNKRQYVVSALKISPEVEAANRELFWFREELLKLVRATWKEPSTGREGIIDLRSMRLSSRMVDALRLEEIGIGFSVSSFSTTSSSPSSNFTPATTTLSSDTAVTQSARSTFTIKPRHFYTLSTTLTNRSSHPILPLLRLQPCLRHQPLPIALDLPRRFVCSGMLQRTVPIIQPGESQTVDLGITALCSGEFEVGASVEEARVWKSVEKDDGQIW